MGKTIAGFFVFVMKRANMGAIYKCEMTEEEAEIVEIARDRIAKTGMGITLTGNRMTVRFYHENELVDVHMIIESVNTPASDARRLAEEMRNSP
jgi:hypothetical protein